ncbi:hypothetical protein GCM10023317_42480 [Actinopolymorpha pittospori]|uniref:Esterase n=1 Tax=Actinopolymorpha pittospori TaxID=648752 RepID=A0A927MUA2_9ACTN|nr:hypothetical protein [Actinopolymorpha pittospori]
MAFSRAITVATRPATPPGLARPAIVEPRTDKPFIAVVLSTFLLVLALLSAGAQPARATTGAATGTGPISGPAVALDAHRPVSGGARVIEEEWIAPRQLDLTIASPALGGPAKVRLLTPDGWEQRRPGQHWPVLFLLHGCCGDYTSWTSLTDVASITELRDVLVVMPEAGDVGFYSDWWNAGTGGSPAWEEFHLTEVRRILERDYGAGAPRGRRSVDGRIRRFVLRRKASGPLPGRRVVQRCGRHPPHTGRDRLRARAGPGIRA